VKTEKNDGYRAVQVTIGERRASRVTKSLAGHYAKASVAPGRGLWEFRLDAGEGEQLATGGEVKVDIFAAGQMVDVQGTTIGKGFAGTIKRHHFKVVVPVTVTRCRIARRAPSASVRRRAACFREAHVRQLGNKVRTQQNLEVVRVDAEKNLLLVKGGCAGAKGSDVMIRPSSRRRRNKDSRDETERDEYRGRQVKSEIEISEKTFGVEFNERSCTRSWLPTATMAVPARASRRRAPKCARWPQAVEPERNRSGTCRLDPQPAVAWRRQDLPVVAGREFHQQGESQDAPCGVARDSVRAGAPEPSVAVDTFTMDAPKTQALIEKLARFGTADALIVTDTLDRNLGLSARNLHLVDVCDVSGVDPVTLVRHEKVIMTVPALKRFEEMLG